ncbi:4Fe-4S dicluster domain-containing protein [Methanobrevibacter filiformis]|uniref:Ferredoxin n=1 Tax=Methanobrevibacter filiformis TaxID=55758 RepID=A0A166A541_9EURY|nr:4Fe-4S dicluster domain-containing protein [Methanobrevibacter filiformis]KZX11582.1 ferredoxin [Methanobrevibacter filiformis]
MRIEQSECAVCGACVDICPLNVIERQGYKIVIQEGCSDCGDCFEVCPVSAIHFNDD